MTKGKIIILIIVLLSGIIGGTVCYLYYSVNSASISFMDLTLETSDSQTFITDLFTYEKFRFTLVYDVTGGYIPITCKDFILDIKLEDLKVGSVQVDDFQTSGLSKRYSKTYLLDLSDLSQNDLYYVYDKFYSKKELKVGVEGSATIDAIVSSKKVTPIITKYILFGSPSINLVEVYWDKTLAQAGESVDFHIEVSNTYRGSQISGTLEVIVMEDIIWWSDEEASTYSFSVTLDAGRSSGYNDSFTVYRKQDVRGFYLRVYWERNLIYEMENGSGYPPRLKVAD